MYLDIIGDIHGCFGELKKLTEKLGYNWNQGFPNHPENRKLAFIGDLTDRGPESLKVIDVVWKLVIDQKSGYYVPGNHCNKLYRFFLGNKVKIANGLETTVAEYHDMNREQQETIKKKFMTLYEKGPLYKVFEKEKLVICHAGIREDFIGKRTSEVKTFVLYGDITGEKNPDGTPVRLDWAKKYKGPYTIVYGHTPVKEPRIIGKTYNIDTGAVFGGKLTAMRFPEMELVSVPSSMPFIPEKFRHFDS